MVNARWLLTQHSDINLEFLVHAYTTVDVFHMKFHFLGGTAPLSFLVLLETEDKKRTAPYNY